MFSLSLSRSLSFSPLSAHTLSPSHRYIPNDLGIPRPYGGLAPFKPTVAPGQITGTMRHMRKPMQREIIL